MPERAAFPPSPIGVLLAGLALLALARLAAWHLWPIFDDAFITATYAANLWDGWGLVANRGEAVLGTTTPLFAILLAPLARFDPQLVLPIAAGLAEALLFGLLALIVKRPAPLAAIFTLYLLHDPLARISAGGMEATLFGTLVLAVLALSARSRPLAATGLATLGLLLRPEAAILGLIAGIDALRRLGPLRAARRCWPALLLLALLALSLAALYGAPLPQSLLAKSGHGSSLAEVWAALVMQGRLWPLLLAFAVFGTALAWRKGDAVMLRLGLFALLYLGLYLAATPQIWTWYAYPPQLALVVLAGYGLGSVLGERLSRLPAAPWLLPAIGLGLMLTVALYWGRVLLTSPPSDIRPLVWGGIAEFCAAEPDLPAKTIAAADIGAIAYFCRAARVLDTWQLIWRSEADLGGIFDIDRVAEAEAADILLLPRHVGFAPVLPRLRALGYAPERRISTETGPAALGEGYAEAYTSDYEIWRRGPAPALPR